MRTGEQEPSNWLEFGFLRWQAATGQRKSIKAFADALGTPIKSLSAWINKQRRIPPNHLDALRARVETTVEQAERLKPRADAYKLYALTRLEKNRCRTRCRHITPIRVDQQLHQRILTGRRKQKLWLAVDAVEIVSETGDAERDQPRVLQTAAQYDYLLRITFLDQGIPDLDQINLAEAGNLQKSLRQMSWYRPVADNVIQQADQALAVLNTERAAIEDLAQVLNEQSTADAVSEILVGTAVQAIDHIRSTNQQMLGMDAQVRQTVQQCLDAWREWQAPAMNQAFSELLHVCHVEQRQAIHNGLEQARHSQDIPLPDTSTNKDTQPGEWLTQVYITWQLRHGRRQTLTEFAQICGLSRVRASRIMNGREQVDSAERAQIKARIDAARPET